MLTELLIRRCRFALCMATNANTQKRQWMSTVHGAHLGVMDGDEEAFMAEMERVWEELASDTRLRYAIGQAERGDEGTLHYQIFTEWKSSVRRTAVCKALPSSSEPMRGTRTQCRKYCKKTESRVYRLPELGVWRPDKSSEDFGLGGPKKRALAYITEDGLKPLEIAVKDPECFFTFHRAICKLYDALQLAKRMGITAPNMDEEE